MNIYYRKDRYILYFKISYNDRKLIQKIYIIKRDRYILYFILKYNDRKLM